MIIGLIRHFKVDISFNKKFYSAEEFNRIMEEYNRTPVISAEVNLNGVDWEVCYSSSLPRAVTTAESIFNGEIIKTDLLREVELRTFTNKNYYMPASLWHFGGRVAWYKEKPSQPENYTQSLARADKFLDLIFSSDEQNVLCVSHGFFMGILFRKLFKKGFTADVDFRPRNGKLYVFKGEK
ncbi:MAG: hypothetical protein A2V66_04005 [Ignavibacteria bacterium RBG_13_36_8]|nr:MAG: hypothetical protein A2V66_04005 [Ignavibacteria bacterium RBG_13_36_8]